MKCGKTAAYSGLEKQHQLRIRTVVSQRQSGDYPYSKRTGNIYQKCADRKRPALADWDESYKISQHRARRAAYTYYDTVEHFYITSHVLHIDYARPQPGSFLACVVYFFTNSVLPFI